MLRAIADGLAFLRSSLLRWGLQNGFVILPKSVTHSRIEANKDIYDFELDKEDMSQLNTKEYSPSAWVSSWSCSECE